MSNKVAIIGYGYVGKAIQKIFPDAILFDITFFDDNKRIKDDSQALINDIAGTTITTEAALKTHINQTCGLAIICVPTPPKESDAEFKAVDLSYIEEVLSWLDTPLILIKSTVPPGTTDKLIAKTGKKICFSPEYIGESKYQISEWKYMSATDPRTHEFQIIGGAPEIRDAVCNYFIKRLGPEKFYYLVDAVEAEIIKYMENSWGALKVIFANEFYQLCKKFNASYIRVREGWALDNRVERMHTAVFVDAEGFAGKCYPKDLNGIISAADQVGIDMSLLKTVLRKNRHISEQAKPEGQAN